MRGSYLSLLVRLSVVERKFSFVVGRSRDWVREREGGREGGRERQRETEREGGGRDHSALSLLAGAATG